MRRRLRIVLDDAIAALARVMLRAFFRSIELRGRERVPRGVPLLIVANHVNSVVDPLVILAFLGARPRILAKSTLWPHPVMGPLLRLAGALPVYRRQDAAADVPRNLQTFDRCHALLAGGGAIALFPEGRSHSQPRMLPLKTGAARIALEAEARHGPLGLSIVPVGLTYEDKGRFRSSLLVEVGEPIAASRHAAIYREGARAAVRALTDRIAAALEAVTLEGSVRDGTRVVEIAAGATPGRGSGSLLVQLPLGFLGMALNWPPYALMRAAVRRLARTPDEPATYALLGALVVFPAWWLAVGAAALAVAGLLPAAALLLLGPLTGPAALRFNEARGGFAGGGGSASTPSAERWSPNGRMLR